MIKIETGDSVFHRPSRETWLVAVANAEENKIMWCGWPEGAARLSDCLLVNKANKTARLKLLAELASGRGVRAGRAAVMLAKNIGGVEQ